MQLSTNFPSAVHSAFRSVQRVIAVAVGAGWALGCLSPSASAATGTPEIQRIASGSGGHVHPAICVTKSQAVLPGPKGLGPKGSC